MDARQVFTAYERVPGAPDETAAYCSACGAVYPPPEGPHRRCERCGHVRYRNPLPAVAVIIADGERFVLCRRRSASLGHGLWCLPSGYIEWEEDYLAAGVREVREETALDVRIDGILSVVTNYLSPAIHSLVIVLRAHVLGGSLEAGDDAAEARWYTWGEPLPPMAFEADTHIITRYFETRLSGAPVEPR